MVSGCNRECAPEILLRGTSDVGVAVVSVSSMMAEPFRSLSGPRFSMRDPPRILLLSEALDGLLEGNWRGTDLEAGGGMEMLARSTTLLLCSGSAERPFLAAFGLVEGTERGCEEEARDLELSELVVRTRVSIGQYPTR